MFNKSFSKILLDFTESGMIAYYFDLNHKLKELVFNDDIEESNQ